MADLIPVYWLIYSFSPRVLMNFATLDIPSGTQISVEINCISSTSVIRVTWSTSRVMPSDISILLTFLSIWLVFLDRKSPPIISLYDIYFYQSLSIFACVRMYIWDILVSIRWMSFFSWYNIITLCASL